MYEAEANYFYFLIFAVLKLWNLALQISQSPLLTLFVHSLNKHLIELCLPYDGPHKRRFEYENDLKESLIN